MRALFRQPRQAPAVRRAEPLVQAAAGVARRLGHGYIGTEHMLLVVADELGMSTADLEADVVARVRRRPPPALDAEALAALGIDLEEVRRRVDASFGAGALERAAELCMPMAPELKRAIALAVDQPGEGPVRAEHVLLALVSTDCEAARILAARHRPDR